MLYFFADNTVSLHQETITMSDVLNEITPLSEKDFFYIVERHKTEFTYPVHQHKEFELNFIEGGAGVRRIVEIGRAHV